MRSTEFETWPQLWQREKILQDQEGKCNQCGIKKWRGQLVVLELEHKDGDRSNNSRDNLELICPNCHSQTHTWRGRNKRDALREVLDDQEWVDAIQKSASIRQALILLGLAPKGNNYERARRIIQEYGVFCIKQA